MRLPTTGVTIDLPAGAKISIDNARRLKASNESSGRQEDFSLSELPPRDLLDALIAEPTAVPVDERDGAVSESELIDDIFVRCVLDPNLVLAEHLVAPHVPDDEPLLGAFA